MMLISTIMNVVWPNYNTNLVNRILFDSAVDCIHNFIKFLVSCTNLLLKRSFGSLWSKDSTVLKNTTYDLRSLYIV